MIFELAIISLSLYPAVNYAEAWLEEVVILLKDPYHEKYVELNKQEHFRSLALAILIATPFAAIAIFMQWYWLLPAIAVNRRLVFDFALKKFRGRKLWLYEGNAPVDNFFKNLFGVNGAKKEFIMECIITVLSVTMAIIFN